MDYVKGLAEWLKGQTTPMQFSTFVLAASSARQRPELWLKAKHEGLLTTYIRDGVLYIDVAEAKTEEGKQ